MSLAQCRICGNSAQSDNHGEPWVCPHCEAYLLEEHLRARIKELESEVQTARNLACLSSGLVDDYREKSRRQKSQIKDLESSLRYYGRHKNGTDDICASLKHCDWKCDCGLVEAITGGKNEHL